jgi:hypothetical protein
MKSYLKKIAAIAAITCGQIMPSYAYVACTVTPVSVFATEEGNFYIFFSNGGIGLINEADKDFKQSVALATAALMTDRNLNVRYPDGTTCTAQYGSIIGLGMDR